MTLWHLRWFVALWVFSGMLMGVGAGVWLAGQTMGVRAKSIYGFSWGGVVLYFVVAGTLGQTYLKLVRFMSSRTNII